MLKQLYIRNFTLIDEQRISFSSGFSVVTGETGAGKSIILGAIALLLGQRADIKAIKPGEDKCVIEAHFDISKDRLEGFFKDNDIDNDPHDCILRREISVSGKSRSFINDIPVQLSLMRELGCHLIDIHSQHQNLLLNQEDFQIGVLDTIADNQKIQETYRSIFKEYQKAQNIYEQLKEEIAEKRKDEDYLRFQCKELNEAKLEAGEQQILEEESRALAHAEEIKSALFEVDGLLDGEDRIMESIQQAIKSLRSIENVYPKVGEIIERMDNCHVEIKDISHEVNEQKEKIEFDPSRLENINARLDMIYRLQQKYHVQSTEELLHIEADMEKQLNSIEHGDEFLREAQLKMEECRNKCEKMAVNLTTSRKGAANKIEKEMKERLIPLGIPSVQFQVDFAPKPMGHDGADRVSFLFSANKSMPLQPISQVASGGEIARVMLALKAMVSGMTKLPTIIFDEIDTGVSGKVAEMMAQIMMEMGSGERQVISITHLPQIAASGSRHYKVLKEETPKGTISRMVMLDSEQRVTEIAQMLSGSAITEAAISNAKELLKLNASR